LWMKCAKSRFSWGSPPKFCGSLGEKRFGVEIVCELRYDESEIDKNLWCLRLNWEAGERPAQSRYCKHCLYGVRVRNQPQISGTSTHEDEGDRL
jgi:hypothetical protein